MNKALSDERLSILSILSLEEWPRLLFTARKKGTWLLLPHPFRA